METDCLICNSINEIKKNKNEYFIKELETGYVVLGWYQYYKGYVLFMCKNHAEELHDLPENFKNKFLQEMALVAEALYKAFKPNKMNYELLGNSERHLHWHLLPRYKTDPQPHRPIWVIDKKLREGDSTKPTKEEQEVLKARIRKEINKLI